MLVLERDENESIKIGANIEIKVLTIRGEKGDEKVRFAIDAPAHVPVHTKETYDRLIEEQEANGDYTGVKSLAGRNQKADGGRE